MHQTGSMQKEMNPASWDASDVERWARQVGLPARTVIALSDREIDGPTLVTLEKDELRSELGIVSLPARRYIWDLILTLRSHQDGTDRVTAIDVLEEEIRSLPLQVSADASAGGHSLETDAEVMSQLWTDTTRQRQIITDRIMALNLQSDGGQQAYEDAELARTEQERLRQLSIQSEFDRRYAHSLDRNGNERPGLNSEEEKKQIATHFGVSIEACVSNKVDVVEAMSNGHIRVIPRLQDIEEANDTKVDMSESTAVATRDFLNKLPFVDHCNVCYEEHRHGFVLACEHCLCISCTRDLFFAAVRDSSLLPLRCCELPIDMNICRHILPADDADTLMLRMAEREATNKMHCPTCSKFINLDYVDAQESTELVCICNTVLCISCKSTSHPRFSCAENRAAKDSNDTLLLELARQEGWKQCPTCNVMIELSHGCNHITCSSCNHEFCFQCLSPWAASTCSTRVCAVWDETRLMAAGEARIEAEENAMQRAIPAAARAERIQRAMYALQANEGCDHEWIRRRGNLGNCERCGYYLPCYGMRCVSDCETTVCFTCASFRIPRRGWR